MIQHSTAQAGSAMQKTRALFISLPNLPFVLILGYQLPSEETFRARAETSVMIILPCDRVTLENAFRIEQP